MIDSPLLMGPFEVVSLLVLSFIGSEMIRWGFWNVQELNLGAVKFSFETHGAGSADE